MRHLPVATLALLLAAAPGASAQTQTIDFENVPSEFIGPFGLLNGYAGFDWSTGFNAWSLVTAGDPATAFLSRPTSGVTNVALSNLSWDTFSRPGDPFTLVSLELGLFNQSTLFIPTIINGYSNGQLLYSVTIQPNRSSMDLIELNWTGVDQVAIDAESPGRILLDDITVTSTPEPGTLALLGLGSPVLLFLRRRARRARVSNPQAAN